MNYTVVDYSAVLLPLKNAVFRTDADQTRWRALVDSLYVERRRAADEAVRVGLNSKMVLDHGILLWSE